MRSINSVSSWDYILFGDINHSHCITDKKSKLVEKFGVNLSEEKIVIVIKEIEGWFLAGLDAKKLNEVKIKSMANTNEITKEDFNRLIPSKYERVEFMLEILERFNPKVAKQKNDSFAYFTEKFGLLN